MFYRLRQKRRSLQHLWKRKATSSPNSFLALLYFTYFTSLPELCRSPSRRAPRRVGSGSRRAASKWVQLGDLRQGDPQPICGRQCSNVISIQLRVRGASELVLIYCTRASYFSSSLHEILCSSASHRGCRGQRWILSTGSFTCLSPLVLRRGKACPRSVIFNNAGQSSWTTTHLHLPDQCPKSCSLAERCKLNMLLTLCRTSSVLMLRYVPTPAELQRDSRIS